MKNLKLIILSLLAICIATLWSTPNHAAGLMTPTGSNLPQLDIREHHVNVVIEDGYAITSCYVPPCFRPTVLKYPPVRQGLIRNIPL